MLTRAQKQRTTSAEASSLHRHWEHNGFVILRHFYSPNQVETINRLVDRLWQHRDRPYKINDLYLGFEEIRRVALSLRLCDVLGQLLGGIPLLYNTLNLEYGSQQPDHVDSRYMTPRRADAMVGCCIALDPVNTGNGPVRYYPGSHRIPARPRDGERTAVTAGSKSEWRRYMDSEIQQRGIHPRVFTAQPGDILIWHSRLLHGGSAIQQSGQKRRSMVAHYFRQQDYRHHLWRVRRRHENGYIYQRRHMADSQRW